MSIFYRGVYTINVNNEPYIQAITKYGKDVHIDKIECGNDLIIADTKDNRMCTNLPDIISKAKKLHVKTMDIYYRSADSRSLSCVFPEILPLEAKDKTNPIAEKLSEEVIYAEYVHHYDIARMGKKPLFDGAIQKDEAINALKILCDELKISRAAHLEQSKALIFENQGICFAFKYGDEADLVKLTCFSFDVDDGFVNKYPEYETALDKQIMNELQTHFQKWKKNGYKNNVIPDSLALDSIQPQANLTSQQPWMFSQSTNLCKQIGVGMVDSVKSMFSIFNNPYKEVKLEIINDIDIASIHRGIKITKVSTGTVPGQLFIEIPIKHEKEIIENLKNNSNIVSINSEPTNKLQARNYKTP